MRVIGPLGTLVSGGNTGVFLLLFCFVFILQIPYKAGKLGNAQQGERKGNHHVCAPQRLSGPRLHTALSQFPPLYACENPALFPLLFPQAFPKVTVMT